MAFPLSTIDLSQEKNIKHYIQQCRLPPHPSTAYFLRDEFLKYYRDKIQNLSVDDIHDQGYFLDITNRKELHQRILDTFFPVVPKDVNVYEYSIGKPISVQDALTHFIESNIDEEKVPLYMKSLVNKKEGTFYDVLQLEDIPLSQVVQLKESGELLSKQSFQELVKSGTSPWGSFQNVGFKSPNGTIFGNLVKYNFDMRDFFPQKPYTTLRIRRIRNLSNIPSQIKPTKIIPTYYFQLTYMNNYHFFIPDTAQGRQVLGLMKDAFKKGNLFAVSKAGRVRHGRIHKKTKLSSSPYGYPDDTYLQRVTEELFGVGSTPYVYQFSNDASYDVSKDPYPFVKEYSIIGLE